MMMVVWLLLVVWLENCVVPLANVGSCHRGMSVSVDSRPLCLEC